MTRFQPLDGDWWVTLAGSAQVSSQALLVSQQFYLGGAAFGRAFQSGWLAGDNGIAGSAELRHDLPPATELLESIQIFGFVEAGAERSYAAPKDRVRSVSAIGGGVRLKLNDSVEAGIAVAALLSYHSPSRRGRGASVLFSLTSLLKACPENSQRRCA